MASINDTAPEKANGALAGELKKIKEIQAPDWAKFVKSGNHRMRPPANPDWWHIRAASVLKNIYNNGSHLVPTFYFGSSPFVSTIRTSSVTFSSLLHNKRSQYLEYLILTYIWIWCPK